MNQPTVEELAGWLREAANKCECGLPQRSSTCGAEVILKMRY